MELIFPPSQVTRRMRGLTYDDVLIVPDRSEVLSRKDPLLTTKLTKKISIDIPVISSNMDTITESDMAIAMQQLGGFGIIHRFVSVADQTHQVRMVKEAGFEHIGASIGVNDDYRERAEAIIAAGADVITVDIAHGHSTQMIDTMKWLKDRFAETIEIVAGNVATAEGTLDLIHAGAGAIKAGIGPGSMCTTRIITGCGVPQLTCLALCAEVADEYEVPIIADGGVKNSGDIVKALAAGASTVMLGSMLAGTIETPGEIKKGRKQYRGMASKAAQVSWRGEVPEGLAPEGESTRVPVKGHVKDVLMEIAGGIRSGMSYINAASVPEIRRKARFIEMTSAGAFESAPHGMRPTS